VAVGVRREAEGGRRKVRMIVVMVMDVVMAVLMVVVLVMMPHRGESEQTLA
jgi:hypothetical protein